MTKNCNYLSLDNPRIVMLQTCVKNNDGFFYTADQRDFSLGVGVLTRSEDNNRIMSKRFPAATWHTNFTFRVRLSNGYGPVVNYKMVGDELGVIAKLKLANKKEAKKALDNGYVVTWERAAPLSFDAQLATLIEHAREHIKRADYLIEKKSPSLNTMNVHLVKMSRWDNRLEFLYKQDQRYVVDASLQKTFGDRLSALFLRYELVRERTRAQEDELGL